MEQQRTCMLMIIFFSSILLSFPALSWAQFCGGTVTCPQGQCCSTFGLCGNGVGYCDTTSCASQCPPPPECGVHVSNAECPGSQCCNIMGYCGTGYGFCDTLACQSQCDSTDSSSPPVEDVPPTAPTTPTQGGSTPTPSDSGSSTGSSKSPSSKTPTSRPSSSKKKSQAWIAGIVVPAFLVGAAGLCFCCKKKKKNQKTEEEEEAGWWAGFASGFTHLFMSAEDSKTAPEPQASSTKSKSERSSRSKQAGKQVPSTKTKAGIKQGRKHRDPFSPAGPEAEEEPEEENESECEAEQDGEHGDKHDDEHANEHHGDENV